MHKKGHFIPRLKGEPSIQEVKRSQSYNTVKQMKKQFRYINDEIARNKETKKYLRTGGKKKGSYENLSQSMVVKPSMLKLKGSLEEEKSEVEGLEPQNLVNSPRNSADERPRWKYSINEKVRRQSLNSSDELSDSQFD